MEFVWKIPQKIGLAYYIGGTEFEKVNENKIFSMSMPWLPQPIRIKMYAFHLPVCSYQKKTNSLIMGIFSLHYEPLLINLM